MADLSDVEQAIVDAAAAALFPGVAYQDDAYAMSAAGLTCSLYRGFPTAAVLDADLLAGRAHVTVFPQPNMTKLLEPYLDYWRQLPDVAPTLTASVAGNVVILGGTATAGHAAGVKLGNVSAAYLMQAGDTPVLVAQALATRLAAVVKGTVTVSGASITLPTDAGLVARVMVPSPALLQTRWQMQGFQITAWCPDPGARDALCSLIDGALAATHWLALSDGSAGQITYQRTITIDGTGREDMWRRDLLYHVAYPTTLIQQQPRMMFGLTNLPGGVSTVA